MRMGHGRVAQSCAWLRAVCVTRILSAVELRKKGIEVRALKREYGIRQINFTNFTIAAFAFAPTLFFPVLTVSDNLEAILRNLIYYEMLEIPPHGNEKFEVSSYLTLMSELISKPVDAKLLHDNGVVRAIYCKGKDWQKF